MNNTIKLYVEDILKAEPTTLDECRELLFKIRNIPKVHWNELSVGTRICLNKKDYQIEKLIKRKERFDGNVQINWDPSIGSTVYLNGVEVKDFPITMIKNTSGEWDIKGDIPKPELHINPNKEDSMETKKQTYPITREGFKKIHDVACAPWQARIVKMCKDNLEPFENVCDIEHGLVLEMFNAATTHNGVDQKEVLREVFPDFDKKLPLPNISGIQTEDKGYYLAWGDADIEKSTLQSMFNAGIYSFDMNQEGIQLNFTKKHCREIKAYIEQNQG